MANNILSSTSDILFESLSSNLSSSILKGLQGGLNLSDQTSQLQVKLLNVISNLSFDSLIYPGASKLEESHFLLPGQSGRTQRD